MSLSIANLTKRLFRRFTKKSAPVPITHARLSVTVLEDRTVPTPLITVAKLADATEGGSAGTFRFTRTETAGSLTVNYTVGGTATEGTDYTSLGTQVTFSSGSATADVSVATINDSIAEADESVVLFLQTGPSYIIGTPNEAIVVIRDNETPVVKVEKNTNALEGDWNGTFWFTRLGDVSSSLTVNFSVGGTATSGIDYPSVGTSVTFAAGSSLAVVEIDAGNDGSFDPYETVVVTLQNGTGYGLGTAPTATLVIIDSATPFVTVAAINDVTEGSPNGTFRFTRTGDTSQQLTVSFSVGGDATSGTDYTAIVPMITFAVGSATADLLVSVINDTDDEPQESVTVAISESLAYAIGNSGSALVAIFDNDLPVVTVTKIVDAAEGGGIGRFRFSRTLGDLSGSLVVGYQVAGTATPGTDYASLSGTVTIAANEATADVVITPNTDGTTEGTETVSVSLWGSGYVIGTPGSVSLDIREEAAGGVSGKMWKDTDGDGTEDAGETGLAYRGVFLMKNGEVVVKAITDANGNYSFSGVTADTYDVLFDVPGDFTPTTSVDGTEPVTVTPGATSTGVSEGCQPPATPVPATGKRDGIDWSTFNESSAVANTFQGIKGHNYKVKTVSGKEITVFVAHPADAQDPNVMAKTNAASIKYNCHGLSLNLQHVRLANGSSVSFSIIDPMSAINVIKDQYEAKTDAATKEALPNKRVIMVIWAKNPDFVPNPNLRDPTKPIQAEVLAPMHTVLVKTLMLGADNKIDLDKSTCDSKDGWGPFEPNVSLKKVFDLWKARLPADAAPFPEFKVIK